MSNLTEKIKNIKQLKNIPKSLNNSGTFEYKLQDSQETQQYLTTVQANLNPINQLSPVDTFNLPEFVEYSAQFATNDTIVNAMVAELADIETKLEIIQFLKSLEKPLKKRANVLYAFQDKLKEASNSLEEAGAYELKRLNKKEIEDINTHLQSENVSKILDSIVTNTDNYLSDFDVSE